MGTTSLTVPQHDLRVFRREPSKHSHSTLEEERQSGFCNSSQSYNWLKITPHTIQKLQNGIVGEPITSIIRRVNYVYFSRSRDVDLNGDERRCSPIVLQLHLPLSLSIQTHLCSSERSNPRLQIQTVNVFPPFLHIFNR